VFYTETPDVNICTDSSGCITSKVPLEFYISFDCKVPKSTTKSSSTNTYVSCTPTRKCSIIANSYTGSMCSTSDDVSTVSGYIKINGVEIKLDSVGNSNVTGSAGTSVSITRVRAA
jgi:hypothetical protein